VRIKETGTVEDPFVGGDERAQQRWCSTQRLGRCWKTALKGTAREPKVGSRLDRCHTSVSEPV